MIPEREKQKRCRSVVFIVVNLLGRNLCLSVSIFVNTYSIFSTIPCHSFSVTQLVPLVENPLFRSFQCSHWYQYIPVQFHKCTDQIANDTALNPCRRTKYPQRTRLRSCIAFSWKWSCYHAILHTHNIHIYIYIDYCGKDKPLVHPFPLLNPLVISYSINIHQKDS